MDKAKQAEISIRDLNKMTKKELRSLISWMKQSTAKLHKLSKGPWLVSRKDYASSFRFSLMKILLIGSLACLPWLFPMTLQAAERDVTWNFQWDDNSDNEKGFYLYIRRNTGIHEKIAEFGENAESGQYKMTAAIEGGNYCYAISAWNLKFADDLGSIQESPRSADACAVVPTLNLPPTAPTAFNVNVTINITITPTPTPTP